MKSVYRKLDNPPALAALDVSRYDSRTWTINRVSVPAPHRGKGIARNMMDEICDMADEKSVWLHLEILASGPMGRQDLIRWYHTFGFRETVTGVWLRRPKK